MLHRIEQRPGEKFSGLIEKFWVLPRKSGKGQWLFESPPDGNFDLVFVLAESRCRVLYVGPFTELQRIPMFNNCEYFCSSRGPAPGAHRRSPRLAHSGPDDGIVSRP